MRPWRTVLLALAALAFAFAGADALAQSKKKRAAKNPPAKAEKTERSAEKTERTAKTDWLFLRNATAPTLLYGAGANDFQISFSCLPENGLLRVISQIGSRGLEPGDAAAIRLVSGKQRFEIAGTAFSAEDRDEVDVGGATRFDPELLGLFKSSERLIIEVPGRKRALPTENAGQRAEQFQKACSASLAGRSKAG